MIYDDYEQEMQRYDGFCYEYYCKLRQNNAALYRALYENWYLTNNFYGTQYGWVRNLNCNSEFSNSPRSSSPKTQSNEERQKNNEYSTVTGLENNDRPEIDFHYYDSYFYGFYDAMRRVNPTMYAILYTKWCASHYLPINIAPGESSNLLRERLPKDLITTHCDTDGSEVLTSDSSAPSEVKQVDYLDKSLSEECRQTTSLFEEYGQTTPRSGHCGNDREKISEVQLNGGVAADIMLPKFHEPRDTQPKQEIKVISSELQTSCSATNKGTHKRDDLSEKKQEKSWINTLLTKLHFSRAEAHLPDDDCPTIIWDSDRKQWVDTTTNENSYFGGLLLPPKSSGAAQSGTNNVYRLKKSRDVRSKYVDVLQTSKQISNVIQGFSNSSEEKSYLC